MAVPQGGVANTAPSVPTGQRALVDGDDRVESNPRQGKRRVNPNENDPIDEAGHVLELGRMFGRFRIDRFLGEGAMGEAFLAMEVDVRQPVVIKVLHPHLARKRAVAARFRREGRALASINHPHVVRVYYATRTDGIEHIVMEYLRGLTLGEHLLRVGAMALSDIVDLMVPVFEGVGAVHSVGIVHRDLKPDNIFVTQDPNGFAFPKVMDFGVARMDDGEGAQTATSAVLGSPAYMSPEQARSTRDADERSDQYSLGVILYELATGQRPFRGKTPIQVLHAVVRGQFVHPRELRPELPEAFEAVVLRAMSYNPAQRYADVRELAAALLPFASARTQIAWAPVVSRPLLAAPRPSSPEEAVWMRTHAAAAATMLGDLDGPETMPASFAPAALLAHPIVDNRVAAPTDSLGAVTAQFTRRPVRWRGTRVLFLVGLFALGLLCGVGGFLCAATPTPPSAAVPVETPVRVEARALVRAPAPPRTETPPAPRPMPPSPDVEPHAAPTVAGPATPALASVRVVPTGFSPRRITFRYAEVQNGLPSIAPCSGVGECRRQVPSGVRIVIEAHNARERHSTTVTPTRDGEEFRVGSVPGRVATPRAIVPPSTRSQQERHCGQINPTTGLMEVCF